MDTIKAVLGIRRTPAHQREVIQSLSRDVAREAKELNDALQPHAAADNPFLSLAIHMSNLRAARKQLDRLKEP